MQEPAKSCRGWPWRSWNALSSYPVIGALLIVLALNTYLVLADPVTSAHPAEQRATAKTWVWWAAKDWKEQLVTPDIVFSGSSVVMHGTWYAEAQHRNKPVELIVDHRSQSLEDSITKLGQTVRPRAFNFGLPGAMMSDQCTIVRAMFNQERPKVLVLGVHPRDFYDNSFHTPAGTKTYQFLARYTNERDPQELLVPEWWERPKFWLQDAVYLKSKGYDLQIITASAIRDALNPVLDKFPNSPLDCIPDSKNPLAMFKDELERGFWIAQPNSPTHQLNFYPDCKRRMHEPNQPMFDIQRQWLEKTLQACAERNIDVLIVSMPLTKMARDVMGDKIYKRHRDMLNEVSSRWKCSLLDMSADTNFAAADFTDWAHLSATGGQMVLDGVARSIAYNDAIVARLSAPSSRQLSYAARRMEK